MKINGGWGRAKLGIYGSSCQVITSCSARETNTCLLHSHRGTGQKPAAIGVGNKIICNNCPYVTAIASSTNQIVRPLQSCPRLFMCRLFCPCPVPVPAPSDAALETQTGIVSTAGGNRKCQWTERSMHTWWFDWIWRVSCHVTIYFVFRFRWTGNRTTSATSAVWCRGTRISFVALSLLDSATNDNLSIHPIVSIPVSITLTSTCSLHDVVSGATNVCTVWIGNGANSRHLLVVHYLLIFNRILYLITFIVICE